MGPVLLEDYHQLFVLPRTHIPTLHQDPVYVLHAQTHQCVHTIISTFASLTPVVSFSWLCDLGQAKQFITHQSHFWGPHDAP